MPWLTGSLSEDIVLITFLTRSSLALQLLTEAIQDNAAQLHFLGPVVLQAGPAQLKMDLLNTMACHPAHPKAHHTYLCIPGF